MIEWKKYDGKNPPGIDRRYLVSDGRDIDIAGLYNYDEIRWYPPDMSGIHESSITHYAEINLPIL